MEFWKSLKIVYLANFNRESVVIPQTSNKEMIERFYERFSRKLEKSLLKQKQDQNSN